MTNSVARVEMLPELQLTGTMGQPALNGQIAVADDGRIQVGGRQYRLRDSRVEFRPERGLMPRLDITGNTRVGDYTVYLQLTGSANEIETSLMSDPPLGERDLQTLLVTGQRESLAQGGDADQMAVGAVSGDVLGFAGQFLGFDSVVVGTSDDLALVSSDVDPALRLTVSKRLGNRFELVLSDNLDDNELTWVIIYRPRPGFEFRAISRGGSEFTGEFRQEIPFGPGVSPPRIDRSSPGGTRADCERHGQRRARPARRRGALGDQPAERRPLRLRPLGRGSRADRPPLPRARILRRAHRPDQARRRERGRRAPRGTRLSHHARAAHRPVGVGLRPATRA